MHPAPGHCQCIGWPTPAHTPALVLSIRIRQPSLQCKHDLQLVFIFPSHQCPTQLYLYQQVGIATRTIIFGTKSEVGLNIGVILAWVALSICTIFLVTVFSRRSQRRRIAHPEAAVADTRGDDMQGNENSRKERYFA